MIGDLKMKIHKRKTLADMYECTKCGTLFSKADLERTYNKPGLGKYKVQPDVEECPFCYCDLDVELAEIVEYPAPVPRNKEIAGLLKRKYQLETKIEQASGKRVQAEGCGFEVDVPEAQIKAADTAALATRANSQNEIFESVISLAETEVRLSKVTSKMSAPRHLPATEEQEDMSGGVTINPQVRWSFWDKMIAIHGFPFHFTD
jgi:hypothetical protein